MVLMSRGRQRGRARPHRTPANKSNSSSSTSVVEEVVIHSESESLPGEEGDNDAMKPKYELEDYIYTVESRSLEPSVDPEDVYAQLQQKEKDLILAAELGKALLEKNEELSRQNELLAEDYSRKLEVIEQDRHVLRRKLAMSQAEYETRLLELQSDLRQLENELQHRDNALRQTDRHKNNIIAELTEQNHRLTTQIKESSKVEEQLTMQLQGLKEQATQRKSTYQDHQSSLDLLKDEISLLTEKKIELERRLKKVKEQRDALSAALDEATDRIMILERQMREQQIQMRVSDNELEELRSMGEDGGASGGTTLGSPWNSSEHNSNRSLHSEMECDQSLPPVPLGDEHHQLKVEIVSVYDRVRALCHSLRQRIGETQPNHAATNPDAVTNPNRHTVRPDITVHQVKAGLLSCVVEEMCELVCELRLAPPATGSSGVSSASGNNGSSLTELEIELHRAQEALDKTAKEMEAKSEELKRRNETIMDLTSKLSVMEAELEGCKEERDRAREDLRTVSGEGAEGGTGTGTSHTEEMLRQAWEVRDGAVARKNAAMVELARTRIEVMQANSQLMEAIQQKIELSQQLDQWQMDMQALLDEQMRRKLMCGDYENGSGASSPATPGGAQASPAAQPSAPKRTPRRLFGIFPR